MPRVGASTGGSLEGNSGSQTRVGSRDRRRIGVTDSTDSACLHPNANLTCSRFGEFTLHYSKLAGLTYFNCFVCVFHVNFLFKLVRCWLYGILCLSLPQRLQPA